MEQMQFSRQMPEFSKALLDDVFKYLLSDPQTMPAFIQQAIDYWVDFGQRTILFWDVLRRRGNKYYQHKEKPLPHVLRFDAELVLDGKIFERPANYCMARIKPPEGVVVDQKKRPFVVVDPRAGHGPGIGGFKADSEIGVAMNAGHPCYCIGFTPDPIPGQTIFDVLRVLAVFLEKVIEWHQDAEGKPCVVGNCQAGWLVMMLAATRPELFGPIIVAGSPLSYWAGVEGQNPMRYSGGLFGGSWLTALTGDLGYGKFDGAYLVSNFENLNPANTFWTKNYNLWAQVDTEAERFLEFETWWGGHVNLNASEMQWIVDQLFIGNQLATAEITTDDGVRIDLRKIRSPIVCFCSKGDNITPPQQALGWIIDLYEKDDDVRACGQTIVYAVHESIGHLGIFVSGGIARKEHEEFASNIDLIDVLPPGLYEAVMISKTTGVLNPDMVYGEWITRFEPRTLNDVRAIVQPAPENELRFATVRRVSETNLGLYRTIMQPFVQALANELTAVWLHKLNPAELPYELFSDRNPLMWQISQFVGQMCRQRRTVLPGNPLLLLQETVSKEMVVALDSWRDLRDKNIEWIFQSIYGAPLLQALAGLRASDESPRRRPGMEPERLEFIRTRINELKSCVAEGGMPEAAIRSLIYVAMADAAVDERSFAALRQVRAKHKDITLEEFKCLLRKQFFTLLLDREAALAAIPAMLPADVNVRAEILNTLRKIISASRQLTGERADRWAQVEKLFSAAGSNTGKTKNNL